MNTRRINMLLIFCLFFSVACERDSEEELYPDNNNDCMPKDVSYSVSISPLIKNYCATVGCHVQGGSGNGIFENYLQIKAKVDNGSFMQRVVVSQDMPPSGSLSDCEIETIKQWLLEGAQDN